MSSACKDSSFELTNCRVAVFYDDRMCLHVPPSPLHKERPDRICAVFAKLREANLLSSCSLLEIGDLEDVDAELDPLAGLSIRRLCELCHDPQYVGLVLSGSLEGSAEFQRMIDEDASDSEDDEEDACDLYYSFPGSTHAIQVAIRGVAEMVRQVVSPGDGLPSHGACVIRPPGHHACIDKAMGYCFVNNVAIAARFARISLNLDRVAIVDWDVHHGNGTKELVASDPGILYISTHRDFYPWTGGLDDSSSSNCSDKKNKKCIHVNFHHDFGSSDLEFVFREIVFPVLEEFSPQLVLISAGFDICKGDPIGNCEVTTPTFGWMTSGIMNVSSSPSVVLVLEGGYALEETAEGFCSCVRALLLRDLRDGDGKVVGVEEEEDCCSEEQHALLLKPGTRELVDLTKEYYQKDWKCFGPPHPQ